MMWVGHGTLEIQLTGRTDEKEERDGENGRTDRRWEEREGERMKETS